jgi:hypothetical protein
MPSVISERAEHSPRGLALDRAVPKSASDETTSVAVRWKSRPPYHRRGRSRAWRLLPSLLKDFLLASLPSALSRIFHRLFLPSLLKDLLLASLPGATSPVAGVVGRIEADSRRTPRCGILESAAITATHPAAIGTDSDRLQGPSRVLEGPIRYQLRYQLVRDASDCRTRKARYAGLFFTPRVGLEPTTLRLTAGCSAN